LDSYLREYLSDWVDEQGNRLRIQPVDDETASVSFFAAPEGKAIPRPWCRNRLSLDMLGRYDPDGESSLEVELGEAGSGFTLHLTFEPEYLLDARGRDALVPGLSRYEEDRFLDQYFPLLGPLKHFVRMGESSTKKP
jgi:hypothetical protein